MDQTNQQFCFTHPAGGDVYLFTLCNAKGTTAGITNYGGILTSLRILQQDVVNNLVLGFDKVEDYISKPYLDSNPFFGAAVGRYGNRIKDGRFRIDGREYELARNIDPDHLHGGLNGFDKKVWTPHSLTTDSVVLKYESKDGEEGYPGNLDVTLRFELNDAGELSYEYLAFTDQPTVINLTHHSYFNLNNGRGTIGDHYVKINASAVLDQDDNLTPTGVIVPVQDTRYDFRQSRRIDANRNDATGYDQSFVLDDRDPGLPAAAAYSEESGVTLQVFTTEPIVHLYTGKSIPPLTGSDGHLYGPFSGFCLETQVHPNAINIPGFPNTILRPGETYHHKTIYKVITG